MKVASHLSFGCMFMTLPSINTVNLNSALASGGHSFYTDDAKSLSKVGVGLANKAGTVSYGEIECTVYAIDESTSYPDVANPLGSTTATTAGSYAFSSGNPAYNEFVFETPISLSANTQYCFLLRNLNATPTTNYFGIRYFALTRFQEGTTTTLSNRENRLASTNNTTWTRTDYSTNWYVTYTDDTSQGLPLTAIFGNNFGQTYTSFRTPKCRMRVNSIKVLASRSGTYTNTSILRITDTITNETFDSKERAFNNYQTSTQFNAFFFDDVVLKANHVYKLERVYTSGTASGLSFFFDTNIYACTDYLNLRTQVTGHSDMGYPNNNTDTDGARMTLVQIFGVIDEPIQHKSSVSISV